MNAQAVDLGRLFRAVTDTLVQHQEALNQADSLNGNHGDHMVQIFRVATLAALEKQDSGLDEAMEYAATLLGQYEQNGSARVYARGLSLLAEQFRQRGVRLPDLLAFSRRAAREAPEEAPEQGAQEEPAGSGEILKALVNALASWEREEPGAEPGGDEAAREGKSRGLDMGYMFGVGMAYLQAKNKGGERVDILADTVVSASPLGKVPHRAQSGRLVFSTLLRALVDSGA